MINTRQTDYGSTNLSLTTCDAHRIRCLTPGVGSEVWGHQYRGELVNTGSNQHINFLELSAAFLALKTFTTNQTGIVLLKMDSISAVSYINQRRGTHSFQLCNVALEIWEWCLQRWISLQAEHLPGILNKVADMESRVICIPTNSAISGSSPNRFICVTANQTATPLLQLEARPGSRSNRFLHTNLDSSKGLCQSPMVPDFLLSESDKETTSQSSSGDTTLAISIMVSSAS